MTDERRISQLSGFRFDTLGNIGEQRQMKAGNDDTDGMAFTLTQSLGENVGLIALFLHGREDSGLCVRMDIGSIVQRPGNRAYIDTCQSCNIF